MKPEYTWLVCRPPANQRRRMVVTTPQHYANQMVGRPRVLWKWWRILGLFLSLVLTWRRLDRHNLLSPPPHVVGAHLRQLASCDDENGSEPVYWARHDIKNQCNGLRKIWSTEGRGDCRGKDGRHATVPFQFKSESKCERCEEPVYCFKICEEPVLMVIQHSGSVSRHSIRLALWAVMFPINGLLVRRQRRVDAWRQGSKYRWRSYENGSGRIWRLVWNMPGDHSTRSEASWPHREPVLSSQACSSVKMNTRPHTYVQNRHRNRHNRHVAQKIPERHMNNLLKERETTRAGAWGQSSNRVNRTGEGATTAGGTNEYHFLFPHPSLTLHAPVEWEKRCERM